MPQSNNFFARITNKLEAKCTFPTHFFLPFMLLFPEIIPTFAAFRVGFGGILADDILS